MLADEGATGIDRTLVGTFLAKRSEGAFRALYRRHTPQMLRLGQRLVASAPAAEDCVQEAWVRAVGALGRFEWQSTLATWLGGFVVNVAREQGRRRTWSLEGAETGAATWVEPLLSIDLADALRRLPAGYRSIIALHDISGFTHAEIAAMLGIDVGTSKSQLARARARIRRDFGLDLTEDDDD